MAGSIDEVEDTPQSKKTALHKRALEDYQEAETGWADNRRLALDDIKFRSGDQWPEEVKRVRSQLGKERPMLVVDKLNQYVRQVVNDARQNRPAVKVRPIDDYGDDEVAEAFQGIIRHICDRSNADTAFDKATEDAVVGGFGFYRVTTEYLHANTFNQEICVKRINNPLSVLLDPNAQEADASDGRYAFIVDEMPKKDFKRRYPNAKYTDFNADGTKYSDGWTQGENVRYAEYFYKEEVESTSHLLETGDVVTDEEYQAAIADLGADKVPAIEESRQIPKTVVKWCRISGAEILEENEWLGKYIPIIRVVGNEYNIEGKVIYSGLIRAAKDPQRLYNYARSAFAERVALTPKSPWLIAEGQIEGYEDEWSKANSEPTVLTYKATDVAGTQVPMPQRVSAADIPEGFARDMQLSEHDIQASMGMYSASIGQAGNERSGKAIMARQREGDTATFHYQDNAARGIKYLGTILVDLIPKIYDSKRVVRILGEDGEASQAEHDPNQEEAVVHMGQHTIYNLNVGQYDVNVSAGPSFTTRRVEQSEAMMELIHNSPEVMQIAGDLLIKSQDWPGAEELAERFRLMLPPPIQQAIAARKEGMPPEAVAIVTQAQQAVQQRDQQIQEMGQAIQEAQQNVIKLELQVKDNTERVQVDLLKLKIEEFKAQTDRMQAEAAMNPQDSGAFDAIKLEYEDRWKKLDAEVRLTLGAMQSETTLKQSAMSANASGDGSTVTEETGEVKASPAIEAIVQGVVDSMRILQEGQNNIATSIGELSKYSRAPRVARRDKNGNLYSEVVG